MLRGINVSGRNTLPMETLRALMGSVGARDVRTYIQSGNVVFSSRRSASSLVAALEGELEGALGSSIPVLIRTKDELDAVVDANPYVHRGEDVGLLHVTFLGAGPDDGAVEAARATRSDADEFAVIGREIYLFCPDGYGRTKFTPAFFERKFGSQATARNWKTVTKLDEMAAGF